MANYISLTAIGKDKPGIVSAITKVLYELKCNIEDSTMTILHGQFAMILILKLPSAVTLKKLSSNISKEAKKLSLSVSYSHVKYAKKKKEKIYPYVISVYGADKTGIVYNISKYLAGKKINIMDVQTTVTDSKLGKTYIMLIEAQFPEKLSVQNVSADLAEISKYLGVSISVNRAESSEI
ncbi:MAG: transcriptional regulator [Endomicrobia bacterium]|nr:transcriptional regulator [Endomicrobiia bacterium]MCL2506149.1 transcriptional regulator [Endomicrobiia bacterium]